MIKVDELWVNVCVYTVCVQSVCIYWVYVYIWYVSVYIQFVCICSVQNDFFPQYSYLSLCLMRVYVVQEKT